MASRLYYLLSAITVFLFVSLTQAQSAQEGTQQVLSVFPALKEITVNGILSEWENADSISFFSYDNGKAMINRATVWTLWDYEKLYIAFKVQDTQLIASRKVTFRE